MQVRSALWQAAGISNRFDSGWTNVRNTGDAGIDDDGAGNTEKTDVIPQILSCPVLQEAREARLERVDQSRAENVSPAERSGMVVRRVVSSETWQITDSGLLVICIDETIRV